MTNRNWRDEALCRGMASADYDPWFPTAEPGTLAYKVERAEAVEVCALCPVRAECLADALDRREPFGVRGGLDEFERAGMTRDARRRAA